MPEEDDRKTRPGSGEDSGVADIGNAARDAQRKAAEAATSAGERLTHAAGRAKERAARGMEDVGDAVANVTHSASGTYARASDLAQRSYSAANDTVAAAPMSSILIAALAGIAVGWAWRGSVEANKRVDLLSQLPRYWRDRLEL